MLCKARGGGVIGMGQLQPNRSASYSRCRENAMRQGNSTKTSSRARRKPSGTDAKSDGASNPKTLESCKDASRQPMN